MKINKYCEEYIKAVISSSCNKEEAISLYKNFFNKSNNSLMSYYFRNFNPFDEKTTNDNIYKYYLNIKSNAEKYTNLIDYNFEPKCLRSFLDYNELPEEIFKHVTINVLMGIGTCHGFTMVEDRKPSINLAIERFINSTNPRKEVDCTIVHEITHVTRMLLGKFKNRHLGDILAEEGLACYFSKTMLALSGSEEDFLLLTGIKSNEIDLYKNFSDLYLSNIYSNDIDVIMKLMHLGDKSMGLLPGWGYNVGLKIITTYLDISKIEKKDIINLDNDMVITSFIKQEKQKC